MKSLPTPLPVQRDKNSIEMARVWIAEQGLHCSLNVGIYKDNPDVDEEKAWGIMLADIARHISSALAGSSPEMRARIIDDIKHRFIEELSSPSSDVQGDFV